MSSLFVIMGAQGAGKGTQAKMLSERFGLPIVATGDMLREIACADTALGNQVRTVQAAGQLVSDDILAEVIKTRLCQSDCNRGCLLDGFPRTLPQTHLLEKIAAEQGHRIIVVKIDLPRELLFRRLTGRLTCSYCGAIYHIEFKPPKREGICDLHDYPLFTRSDDNKEAIQQRLALFDEKTRPLLNYYAETNRLHRVDGTGTPKEVFERLSAIFARETGLNVERQAATDE